MRLLVSELADELVARGENKSPWRVEEVFLVRKELRRRYMGRSCVVGDQGSRVALVAYAQNGPAPGYGL